MLTINNEMEENNQVRITKGFIKDLWYLLIILESRLDDCFKTNQNIHN